MATTRRAVSTPSPTPSSVRAPQSAAELKAWIHGRLHLSQIDEADLLDAIESVLARQRELLQESKLEAIQALSQGFAEKLSGLHQELSEKDATVKNVGSYFEGVVADLSEKTHRDPKTKLMNAEWFKERLQSFLAVEQRVRWCALGVVDITSFKSYNDTLGHTAGDLIIERVAEILAEQIRSEDLLAQDFPATGRDLHARFGGDEFCFLIPNVPGPEVARLIAERFKEAVRQHPWDREHPLLAHRPVSVDVGVVCLRMGRVDDRRGAAAELTTELIKWADKLMYKAKSQRARHIHPARVRIERGRLVEIRHPLPFRKTK